MSTLCVCNSGKTYAQCCKMLHDGAPAQNGLQLMRSRYAAYVLQKPDYIIRTTHPSNPLFKENQEQWKREILFFCQNTQFQDLKIIEFMDGEFESFVTFLARLSQNGQDVSFIEKSLFEKVDNQWLYKAGTLSKIDNDFQTK